MKTPVQTLIDNLYNHEYHIDILDVAQFHGYFEQALKAEKEQIVNAYLIGIISSLEMPASEQAEQYYQENFESNSSNNPTPNP
jgi:hypothetical protein